MSSTFLILKLKPYLKLSFEQNYFTSNVFGTCSSSHLLQRSKYAQKNINALKEGVF